MRSHRLCAQEMLKLQGELPYVEKEDTPRTALQHAYRTADARGTFVLVPVYG